MENSYEGRHVVVLVNNLTISYVIVIAADPTRRFESEVGIAFSDNVGLAGSPIAGAEQSQDAALGQPAPDALAVEPNDSSLHTRACLWFYSRQREVVMVNDEVIAAVK